MIGDYQIHIHIPYGSFFAANLFQRIVKEVKKNCVKINHNNSFYVGKEMYKYRDNYVFWGQCFAFPLKLTDDGDAKIWWDSERVRKFMEKPLEDQVVFLKEVFENRIINDYKFELKNYTETYQMYQGVMLNVARYKEFDFFDKFMPLFNDESKITSPLVGSKTAMEELKDIVVNLSFARKEEGIQVLLDSLEIIPDKGYNCGSVSIIKTLLQKKYFDIFKNSLVNTLPKTKNLVISILDDITEKRLVKLKDEIICFLNSEV